MIYINRNKFLEETIEKYSNMVYRLAMARTRNIETSEDIYQEVFLRLARKMPEFENEEHKKAWLIRVTINCTKTILNSSFLKHRAELDENLSFETPERHDIYYAVFKLPIKYRTVVHLYYYENYSIKEISKILKVNENTIKSRLSRARKELEKFIKGGIEDE